MLYANYRIPHHVHCFVHINPNFNIPAVMSKEELQREIENTIEKISELERSRVTMHNTISLLANAFTLLSNYRELFFRHVTQHMGSIHCDFDVYSMFDPDYMKLYHKLRWYRLRLDVLLERRKQMKY